MSINEEINAVKLRIKSITKHFYYSEEVIDILAICYIAIVSFDNDVMDILEEVLATKCILINGEGFETVFENYYFDFNPFLDRYVEPTFDEKSICDDDFIVIRKFNILGMGEEWSYYDVNRPICGILESFLHEIKHAMNSIIKRYNNGLFYCVLCVIDVYDGRDYELLEEAFNSFLVYLYLQQVEKLLNYDIEDMGIKTILERFSLGAYRYSYYKVTRLLAPLFSEKELFRLFYNAVLFKDYNPLFLALKRRLGNNIFYILHELLEKFSKGIDCSICDYIDNSGECEVLSFDNATIEKMTL